MTLFMIGIGLFDEKDISIRGLEIVKKCSSVYLENYTSILQNKILDLEKSYCKKIIIADRDLVEGGGDDIVQMAKYRDVAFLVVGDPMCATTHIDLYMRAKEKNVSVKVVHNASIVSAVGEVGLEIYKYGKTTSIPFHNKNVKTPVDAYRKNLSLGFHTLFLLDLDPKNSKYLSIQDACQYLIQNGVDKGRIAIGCARIGSDDQIIRTSDLENLGKFAYGNAPYCIIIPGNMHFVEEEAINMWKE